MSVVSSAAAHQETLSDTEFSFVPPDGIIVPVVAMPAELRAFVRSQVSVKTSGQVLLQADEPVVPTAKFAVFSSDFINLQLSTVKALSMPMAAGDFDQKYGTFASKDKVVKCIDALKELNTHCSKFGNPATLVTEIQQLAAGAKPATLYGQIVWLSQQIATTADTFSFTLGELTEALKSTASKEERYEILKELLTGDGGMVSEAIKMEKAAKELRDALLAYLKDMKDVKAPIDEYFGLSSTIFEEAVAKNKDVADRLILAQAELESVRAEYVKYVAAATASSVGVFVLSGGILWPISAVLGGVLGDLAEKARKRANEVEAEIGTLGTEAKKKTQLVNDVNSLSASLTPLEGYLTAVSNSLADIAGVWGNVVVNFHAIVANTSPDTLKDLAVIQQRFRIRQGQDKWAKTAAITYDFTAKAFVEVQAAS